MQLKGITFQTVERKHLFTQCIIKRWNSLLQHIITDKSFAVFQRGLDIYRMTTVTVTLDKIKNRGIQTKH